MDEKTGEPKLARLLLRRMLGSLTLSGAARPSFVKWDADVKPGILAGIVPIDLLASATIPSWNQIAEFLKAMQQLRDSTGLD